MANKIIKGEWSVKQTRKAIDRKLNPTPSPHPPGPDDGNDPLASVWANIKAHPPEGWAAEWQVKYGPEETWSFVAKPRGGDYAEFLSDWFSQMAESLSPLATPAFTKTTFDAQAYQVEVAWNFVPNAESYELYYSYNYPQGPLRRMVTAAPIYGPTFTITFDQQNHTALWLAIKAIATGRASPLSTPVHILMS